MPTAAAFSTVDVLRNGQRVEIRALRSTDREDMLTAVGRTSTQSLYRRFFTVRRHFSEAEASFFLNPDFVTHVALVAVAEEDGKPVIAGGGRYVVIKPGQAEVAFAVVDQFQGPRNCFCALAASLIPCAQSRLARVRGRGFARERSNAKSICEE